LIDNKNSGHEKKNIKNIVLITISVVIAVLAIWYVYVSSQKSTSLAELEKETQFLAMIARDVSIVSLEDSVLNDITVSVAEKPSRRDKNSSDSNDVLVALIIDDFGPSTNRETIRGFIDLPYDITISIIPGNDRSVSIGQEVSKAGKDVFIHLPMEPKEPASMDERDMVYASDDHSRLETVFSRVLKDLPQAVGLNNHMGSRAMADTLFLKNLAVALKSRDLVFVDSRTDKEFFSIGIMRKAGVSATSRDIFLDYAIDTVIIEDQFARLIRIARKRGWAVGIGHVKQETLEVLQRKLPIYENEGIKFVFVRDLITDLSQ
jgi:uncharacterized protein